MRRRELLVLLLLAPLLLAFTTPPTINNGEDTYTDDALVCTWQASGTQNVTWAKDGENTTTLNATNTATINATNTTKGETWTCYVSNASTTLNTTVEVLNSPPTEPDLYYNGTNYNTSFTLTEDQTYNFSLLSNDLDNDSLIYGPELISFCDITLNRSTGEFSCTPSFPDETDGINTTSTQVEVNAREEFSSEGYQAYTTLNLTVVPVNKQPNFTEQITTINLNTSAAWNRTITATDREGDYPLTFNVSSNLTENNQSVFILQALNQTSRTLTVNATDNIPKRIWEGTWQVNITVNDNASNLTPTTQSFDVTITADNIPPEFTNSFPDRTTQQGQTVFYQLNATDNDTEDTLTFTVTPQQGLNTTQYCTENNPWIINTTNSSATGGAAHINQTVTNDHIICRDVVFTVEDPISTTDTEALTLNLTNVNDAPIIHNTSADGNITPQAVYQYTSKTYNVNISDPDQLTYNAPTTASLTLTSNNSAFQITNQNTLTFNKTTTAGNYSVQLTLSDGALQDTENITVEMLQNNPPIISVQNPITRNETDSITFNVTATDDFGTNLTLNITAPPELTLAQEPTLQTTTTNGTVNAEWTVDYTENNALTQNRIVGTHNISLRVVDSVGGTYTGSATNTTLTIQNEENTPSITAPNLGVVVRNKTTTTTLRTTDYDYEAPGVTESLTVNIANHTSQITNVTLTNSTVSNGVYEQTLTFEPIALGDAQIFFQATDITGNTDTYNVTFEVFNSTLPPNITEVTPFMFNDALQTGFTTNTDDKTVSFEENQNVTFDALATPRPPQINNSDNNLTYTYIYDNSTAHTATNVEPGNDSAWTNEFDYFTDGVHTVELRIEDSRRSISTHTWTLNITNINRPPTFENNLPDIQTNRSIIITNYFSFGQGQQYFYDPDDDLNEDGIRSESQGENTSLTYSFTDSEMCSALADFTFSDDDIDIDVKQAGVCYVKFQAEDPFGETVESNILEIDIDGDQEIEDETTSSEGGGGGGGSSSQQRVTVPIEEEVDVPEAFRLIVPNAVTSFYNRTMVIPITLENTWDEALNNIELSSKLEGEPNATVSFSDNLVEYLEVGDNITLDLEITNFRNNGPYEVIVQANSTDPEYGDEASIFINSLEDTNEGDPLFTRVTFARDLISENPECRELNELVAQAEAAIQRGDSGEALRLSDAMINGCRYLLTEEEARRESPSVLQASTNFVGDNTIPILIGSGVLLIISTIGYAFAALRSRI